MILQQRNGRRKCTKTKVKNSSFRNKYDRVEAEDPEDAIAQPKNKGGLISECIIDLSFRWEISAFCFLSFCQNERI